MKHGIGALVGLVTSVGCAAAPAAAQVADGAVLEELVVTAQKRSENLQDVPMSISAMGGEQLVRAGVADFQDYAVRIPNLAFGYTNSVGGQAQSIAIRGIFGAGTTGMYLDDAPLPASIDPRVLDLERIEVLRGPQGTLYGARSMGGTVRLITRQPAPELGGSLHAVASGVRRGGASGTLDGVLNVPVGETFAVRATAFADYQSGVFDRVAAPTAPTAFGIHKDVDAVRRMGGQLAGRLEFDDGRLVLTPRVIAQETVTKGRPLSDIDAGRFAQIRQFDIDETGRDQWALYTLTGNYKAPFGTIISSTSFFDRKVKDSEDFSELAELLFGVPPTPAVIRAGVQAKTFAQELRFTSSFEGPLNLTAGLFYQESKTLGEFPPTPIGVFIDNLFSQRLDTRTTEKAVFAEARWALTERLAFIAGARAFDNQVKFDGVQDGAAVSPESFSGVQKERGVNPKFGAEFQATDDALLYVTAAKGFRIGGVNSFSSQFCAADLARLGLTADSAKSYDSDSLWNYEGGAKTSWFGRRLTVNGALYRIEWSGIQQVAALTSCGFFATVNAGRARSEGGELEIQAAPAPGLRVALGGGYANSRILETGGLGGFQPGQRVQQVPQWTLNAALDYDFEAASVPLSAHVDYAYVGGSFSTNNDSVSPRRRAPYALVNARLSAVLRNVRTTLFVENVFDISANLSDIPPLAIEYPGRPRVVTNRPRTIGVEARVDF